ncbi:hypothetical protein VULLAG_LOCUS22238 [Vulpes lagopus]
MVKALCAAESRHGKVYLPSSAAAAQPQSPAGERSNCELASRSPAASPSSPRDAALPVISADVRTPRRTTTSEPLRPPRRPLPQVATLP